MGIRSFYRVWGRNAQFSCIIPAAHADVNAREELGLKVEYAGYKKIHSISSLFLKEKSINRIFFKKGLQNGLTTGGERRIIPPSAGDSSLPARGGSAQRPAVRCCFSFFLLFIELSAFGRSFLLKEVARDILRRAGEGRESETHLEEENEALFIFTMAERKTNAYSFDEI